MPDYFHRLKAIALCSRSTQVFPERDKITGNITKVGAIGSGSKARVVESKSTAV